MEFERESRCPAFHENFQEQIFKDFFIKGWIALSVAGKFEVSVLSGYFRIALSTAGKFEVSAL